VITKFLRFISGYTNDLSEREIAVFSKVKDQFMEVSDGSFTCRICGSSHSKLRGLFRHLYLKHKEAIVDLLRRELRRASASRTVRAAGLRYEVVCYACNHVVEYRSGYRGPESIVSVVGRIGACPKCGAPLAPRSYTVEVA
jgi:hypothetical protein